MLDRAFINEALNPHSDGSRRVIQHLSSADPICAHHDLLSDARADVIEDNTVGTNSFAEASAEYAVNDNITLAAGVSYNDDGRGNEGTAVGARAEYNFNDDAIPYGCSWYVEVADSRLNG